MKLLVLPFCLWLALLTPPSTGNAQVLASVRQEPGVWRDARNTPERRSLKDVLQEFKTHYDVDIVYFNSAVEQVWISPADVKKGANFEKSLQQLLQPHALTLKKGKNGGYIITRKNVRKNEQSSGINETIQRNHKEEVLVTPVNGLNMANLEPRSYVTAPAADQTLSGKVVDESGQPLPGVTVLLKGTDKGTSTDLNGAFELSITDAQASNGVLVFSFIG